MEKLRQFDMESYRILAELSNAIMFEWDIPTDCFYVSQNWNTLFPSDPQKENFSQNFSKIFSTPPHQSDELTPYIENVKQNNSKNIPKNYYHKIELQLLTKKQTYIWFQLRLLLRYDTKDLPDKVFGMMTDIDLQKKGFSVKCWGNPVQVNLTGGLIMTIGIFMPWKIELCFVIS